MRYSPLLTRLLLLSVTCVSIYASPVVLVTGASKGIGRATANLLSENGYTVYGTSRAPSEEKTSYHPIALDVTDTDSVKQAVQYVMEKEGRIDVLINSAGMVTWGSVENVTIDEAKYVFEVNFFGPMRLAQEVLPIMRAQKSGKIIQLSSRSGYRPLPSASVYAASKFALEGLSETMAVTLKPWNIQVSLIEPGPVNTDFDQAGSYGTNLQDDPYRAIFENAGLFDPTSPIMQQPEDIAQVIKEAIESPDPSFRYQTSLPLQVQAAKRFVDITGDTSMEEWESILFPQ